MLRSSSVWMLLHVLHIYGYTYSLAQDISQIPRTIEEQRETVRIRNRILKELENNGARLLRVDTAVDVESPDYTADITEEINTDTNNDIKTEYNQHAPANPMVSVGEPASVKRDKCLIFKIGKYVKHVQHIVPFRITLWVHLRKKENQKTKRKKTKHDDRIVKAGGSHGIRRADRHKNKGRKNRKRRRGRRIKIFVSNGTKRLVEMRMRVRETNWYKIELPISQFPDIINANDSFKLCFKCKRCSKKIKLDMYRRRNKTMKSPKEQPQERPKIPFIHFETRSHSTFRYKRSNDVINNKHQHHHLEHARLERTRLERTRFKQDKDTCCQEKIYTDELSKLSPKILYPESVDISLCGTKAALYVQQPLLPQSISHRPLVDRCVTRSLKTFNFVFIDNQFSIRNASIPNLIPSGCSCHRFT